MKKSFLVVLFFHIIIVGFSQKFPIPVKPGDSLIIKLEKYKYEIKVENDTLWVMKNSQLQNAIIKAKKLQICEEEIVEYKKNTSFLKEQSIEKDSLISILKKDRDFYQKSWKECDTDIQKVLKDNKRLRLYKNIAYAGIPAAFIIGFLVRR